MRKAIFILLLTIGMLNARANKAAADTTYDPVQELALLHIFYSDTGKLSFDCTFYMKDIDTVTTNDTMVGYYKLHNDKFKIIIDSVESLQDDLYNMTAYYADSLIFVQRRAAFTQKVTQVNLYDPALRNDYIDGISIYDSTAALRILRFHFKDHVPFSDYKMVYDTAHKIISINYSVRKYPYADIDLAPSNYFLKVRIEFSNYQFSGFTDDIFSTSKFALRQGGAFQLATPYVNYQLVNSANQ